MRRLLLVPLAVFAAAGASADDAADRGQALAERWCQRCHVIGNAPQPSAVEGAPAWPGLLQRPGFTVDTLRQALLAPHPPMPEFPVSERDIADLMAYLRSIRPELRTERQVPPVR